MALIHLNRVEAAGRQIDTAIRMTFAGEDPVAIHAITAGIHRIIQDFHRGRGDAASYLRFGDWIELGHEARLWRYFNAAAEFLKQAEWDPAAVFDLEEDTNDFMIVFAARWYQTTVSTATREMRVFATWYVACNPGLLRADAMLGAQVTAQMETMAKALQALSRSDRLRAGHLALEAVEKPANSIG